MVIPMTLKAYHLVWMKWAGKDEEWMWQALENGFDVCCVGEGEEPGNLVLIWAGDNRKVVRDWVTLGQVAYERRLEGRVWRDVGVKNALVLAKNYAVKAGKEWPLKVKTKYRYVRSTQTGV